MESKPLSQSKNFRTMRGWLGKVQVTLLFFEGRPWILLSELNSKGFPFHISSVTGSSSLTCLQREVLMRNGVGTQLDDSLVPYFAALEYIKNESGLQEATKDRQTLSDSNLTNLTQDPSVEELAAKRQKVDHAGPLPSEAPLGSQLSEPSFEFRFPNSPAASGSQGKTETLSEEQKETEVFLLSDLVASV